jgi:regulation of enolase protein 1 (concanavalin A-like superfamily)
VRNSRGHAMPQSFRWLSLIVIASLASLGRADDAKPRKVSGGAEFVDPDGDCKLREEKGKWTLEVPGAYYDLWPKMGKVNAPRILKEAEGDFSVQVKVLGSISAEADTAIPGRTSKVPFRAASLLIWQDDATFVRLDRAAMVNNGKLIPFCYYHAFKDGERMVHVTHNFKDSETILRLERRGNKIVAAASQDGGKAWSKFGTQTIELAKKVKVGVAALNGTTKPLTAEFEGLTITPVKE